MRARFYPVGRVAQKEVIWVDSFPVVVSRELGGRLSFNSRAVGEQLCLIDECQGNLVIKDCVVDQSVRVNGLPIIQGGLMPGDKLAVEDDLFIVSYERVTTASPLRTCYHIASN